jgi:hypothetical protein
MQNNESDLKVQGIAQGLSFHKPNRIGMAGIVSTAFIIGYEMRTANNEKLS